MKPIFLDRDGVINRNKGYVFSWDDFSFLSGSLNALQILTRLKYDIFIITNQSGIARGYYSETDVYKLHTKLLEFLMLNHVRIAGIYFCPHHPTVEHPHYGKECKCRKPRPGMLLQAASEYDFNCSEAIMIGDKVTDVLAGYNAGVKKSYLISDNEIPLSYLYEHNAKRVSSLLSAVLELQSEI